jgi:hypothetical protein
MLRLPGRETCLERSDWSGRNAGTGVAVSVGACRDGAEE